MKYLKLLLVFLVINSCKGQQGTSDFSTTWYEVKKQGDNFIIVDCGYEGQSFKIQNDSIFDHDIMEDSTFKIHHILKEGNLTSFYINENDKYSLSWINKEKGIIKRVSEIDGNITKYYVNQTNLNKIKKIKGTSKDCISSEENNDSQQPIKAVSKNNFSYSADGTWKTNCSEGIGSMTIKGKEASLVVMSNQIYIQLVETKRYDSEKGIAYKLKKIPEDLGNFGIELPWKDYLNDETIAYVKVLDNKTLNFYWYGFYNDKIKKRDFKESNFNQESKQKDIVLQKCE